MILAQSVVPGGISTPAHIFIGVVTLIVWLAIIRLLRHRQLRSKYALLWTATALALGVFALFPGILDQVSRWVGIDYPPALFLLVATGVLFLVIVEYSVELSRLDERTRRLAEEVALIRAERDLDPAPPERDGSVD